jgi:xanthine dehydrogenase accessory factor
VHIAEALCVMARAAGYAVTIVDPRSAFLRPERFPDVQLVDQWPQQAFRHCSRMRALRWCC